MVIVYQSVLYIYGGYDADGFCSSDIYCYHTEKSEWSRHTSSKGLSKQLELERYHHSAISTGNAMIVFGGKDSSGKLPINQLLEYHYPTNTWSAIQSAGLPPCPRWGHCTAAQGLVK